MPQQPTYQFTPSVEGIRAGAVTIVRPLGPDEADLWETGPMFRVRFEYGPAGFADAFLDELTPRDDAPDLAWGDWWDAEDYESSGGSQFYIETGERQTHREAFEHSIAYGRISLAAEAITRRAATEAARA